MIRVLLVSQRIEVVRKYEELVKKLRYDFVSMSDAGLIADYLSASMCEIVIIDTLSGGIDFKNLLNKLRALLESSVLLFITDTNLKDRELIKFANGFLFEDMGEELISGTIAMNLRMRSSLEKLADTNRDLADSNYRLNALYSTSSQFAGTLDKEKLINYMLEGMDKALSFSLTSTLSFCTEEEPVLLINSLYEISPELIDTLKLRMVLHYKSLFEGKKLPFEIDTETLKVRKFLKFPASRFNFSLLDVLKFLRKLHFQLKMLLVFKLLLNRFLCR